MTWYPPDDSVRDRFFDPFLHRRDVLLGNSTTHDLVLNRDALSTLPWFHFHHDVSVLTTAAGLLDQFPFAGGVFGDRFAIGDLGFAGVRIDLELAQHTVPDDFQMELAHPGNNRLPGIFVGIDAESWIFFRQSLKCSRHFLLIDLCLRLDRHRDNRLRKRRRFEKDRVRLVTERVAGSDIFDANDGRDIA